MADILMRDIPDDVAARLATSAQNNGRSVQEEALELVRRGLMPRARFSVDEARSRVLRNHARFAKPLPSTTLGEIRDGLAGVE